MLSKQPRLSLVEAGPGEIDLITVKGLKALRAAKVIVYDAAVNETLLLEYAPNDALKIFVGARGRHKALSPNDIREIIVEYAVLYGHVVQLIGSNSLPMDASMLQYAQSKGLNTEYIPGVPAQVARFRPAISSSN